MLLGKTDSFDKIDWVNRMRAGHVDATEILAKVFFVVGAERAGTRLMTHLLVEAGVNGEYSHRQQWDDPHLVQPAEPDKHIVFRRGYPHSSAWPDLWDISDFMGRLGYTPHIVWMVRDWYPQARAQEDIGFAKPIEAAYANIQQATKRIVHAITAIGCPYEVVTYEGLVTRPNRILAWLTARLDLTPPEGWLADFEIWDADGKWWEDEDPDMRSN